MRRKALALLLAVAMMVTFMPTMAFAESPSGNTGGQEVQNDVTPGGGTGEGTEGQEQPSLEDLQTQIDALADALNKLKPLIDVLAKYGDEFETMAANAEKVLGILHTLNTSASDFLDKYSEPAALQEALEQLRDGLNQQFMNQLRTFAASLQENEALQREINDFIAQYESLKGAVNNAIKIVNDAVQYGDGWVNAIKVDLSQLEAELSKIVTGLSDRWNVMLDNIAQNQKAAFEKLQGEINQWLTDTSKDLQGMTRYMIEKALGYVRVYQDMVKSYQDFIKTSLITFGEEVQGQLVSMQQSLMEISNNVAADVQLMLERVNSWLTNANGYIKGLNEKSYEALVGLHEAIHQAIEQQQEYIKGLPEDHPLKVLINQNQQLMKQYKDINEAIEGIIGTAMNIQKAALQELLGDINALNNNLKVLTMEKVEESLNLLIRFNELAIGLNGKLIEQLEKIEGLSYEKIKALSAQAAEEVAKMVQRDFNALLTEVQRINGEVQNWLITTNNGLKKLTKDQMETALRLAKEFQNTLALQRAFIKNLVDQQHESFTAMLTDLQELSAQVEERVATMVRADVEALLTELEEINGDLQKWISSSREITQARMKEAYKMIQECQAYLACVQDYVTGKVIEQNKEVEKYLADLQQYVSAELVKQNEIIRGKLEELQAKAAQMEECVAEMLQKQLTALQAKSAEVLKCTRALARATSFSIAKNISETMKKMAELQEMATVVLAQYQECFAEMSKAAQEQIREQLVEAMAAFEQASQQFQAAAEKINAAIAAAKAGNIQKMMELFDMIKNFDYKGLAEEYIKDLMSNADIEKILEEFLKIESKIEETAGDIIGYGNALIEGGIGSTPYGDGLVAQTDVQDLESMNSQLKVMITKLNQDAAELAKANEDLQKVVQKGDADYKELVSHLKNTQKVMKKKVALKKKATKSTKTKQITIKWKKWNAANGEITKYQVYYKADGAKAKKKTVGKNKTKYVAKKLRKGKTYTVKVRAVYKLPYKNEAGQTKYLTFYSKWSKSKKVTVK